jgi:hypothetical protein
MPSQNTLPWTTQKQRQLWFTEYWPIGMLAEHPRLDSRIPELLPKSRYRQIVESPCRVFHRYEPATGSCYILHVIRGEKLFQRRLLFKRDLKM